MTLVYVLTVYSLFVQAPNPNYEELLSRQFSNMDRCFEYHGDYQQESFKAKRVAVKQVVISMCEQQTAYLDEIDFSAPRPGNVSDSLSDTYKKRKKEKQ